MTTMRPVTTRFTAVGNDYLDLLHRAEVLALSALPEGTYVELTVGELRPETEVRGDDGLLHVARWSAECVARAHVEAPGA